MDHPATVQIYQTAPWPPLLRMSRDIRLPIYKALFNMSVIPHGKHARKEQGLGILRACRTTYEEAKGLWLSRISFDFDSTWDFLRYFMKVDIRKIPIIRHASVRAYRINVKEVGENLQSDSSIFPAYFGRIMQASMGGLALDTFTVEVCHRPIFVESVTKTHYNPEKTQELWFNDDSERNLSQLITSSGWRELRVVVATHELFAQYPAVANDEREFTLSAPIFHIWEKLYLRSRAGKAPDAHVVLFRAKNSILVEEFVNEFDVDTDEHTERVAKNSREMVAARTRLDALIDQVTADRWKERDVTLAIAFRGSDADVRCREEGPPGVQLMSVTQSQHMSVDEFFADVFLDESIIEHPLLVWPGDDANDTETVTSNFWLDDTVDLDQDDSISDSS